MLPGCRLPAMQFRSPLSRVAHDEDAGDSVEPAVSGELQTPPNGEQSKCWPIPSVWNEVSVLEYHGDHDGDSVLLQPRLTVR